MSESEEVAAGGINRLHINDPSFEIRSACFLGRHLCLARAVGDQSRLGIDEDLVILLGSYSPVCIAYSSCAGGVTTMANLDKIKTAVKDVPWISLEVVSHTRTLLLGTRSN
ncbi:hypothetical protein ZIOFF_073529 [Zingiber officinale]|uniref:Uncharacterized protein n=1 Tax=Zingiber officinale TaxID=94328 RepID=A0A8J5C0P8_ZINOF|nr:hypothetical protein ZIOFF_073529 [Zingiber officinale]